MVEENIDIMQLPAGVRVNMTVERINNGNGVIEHDVTLTATTTSRYRFCFGAWRRLFIDADREFYPGQRSIWLSAKPRSLYRHQEIHLMKEITTEVSNDVDKELVLKYASNG